ncbi:MAG: rod shape-determining protein MreD [Porticoccaceae bacterium]
MGKTNSLQALLIILSVVTILQLVPVDGKWLLWRPNLLLIVMITWMLYFPDQYGIEFSVMLGVLADFIFGTNLGFYVLVFTLCGAVVAVLHRVVAYLELIHQAVLVSLLALAVECLKAWANIILDKPVFWQHVPYIVLASLLFWLPLDRLVKAVHRWQRQ